MRLRRLQAVMPGFSMVPHGMLVQGSPARRSQGQCQPSSWVAHILHLILSQRLIQLQLHTEQKLPWVCNLQAAARCTCVNLPPPDAGSCWGWMALSRRRYLMAPVSG